MHHLLNMILTSFVFIIPLVGRRLSLDVCNVTLEHKFGHGQSWARNSPYIPSSDLIISETAKIDDVLRTYDAIKVSMFGALYMNLVLQKPLMTKETVLLYSMKISNYFDYGDSGILPGLILEGGKIRAYPVWSKMGFISLVVAGFGDDKNEVVFETKFKINRNRWFMVKMSIYEKGSRQIKLYINDELIASLNRIKGLDMTSGVAFQCKRFGGNLHSFISFGDMQVLAGNCVNSQGLQLEVHHDEL